VLQPRSLNELLQVRAQSQPDDLAFRCLTDSILSSETLTYAALDRRARGLASTLARHAVEGGCIAIILPTSVDFLIAFFGGLYAGAAIAPLAPATSPRTAPRLRALLTDLKPRVVLTCRTMLNDMTKALRTEAGGNGLCVLAIEDLATDDPVAVPASMEPHDVAVLQYTSGSTSTPKGVQVTHDNMLRQGAVIGAVACGETSADHRDSFVSWLPLYHDMGLVGGVIAPLCNGTPSTLIPPTSFARRPALWLEAISHFKGTISPAPNFAYELCCDRIDAPTRAALDLRSWRAAFCGAEPIRASTLQRFQETFEPHGLRPQTLLPCYGLAEATLFVSGVPIDKIFETRAFYKAGLETEGRARAPLPGEAATTLVSCGRPHDEQILAIVDPETSQRCDDGRIGEIWISGPHVASGYKDRPDATRETFGAVLAGQDGRTFLRTGDLGFLHEGALYIAGRLKDLIIVRGANHYPQDIEATATASHPLLSTFAAAAFSIEAEEGVRCVLIHEIPRTLAIPAQEIADAIRRQVAVEHGVHLDLVVLGRLGVVPRTSSGKVQRRAARELLLSGGLEAFRPQSFAASSSRPSASPRPSGTPQARIRALWAEALGHDSFSSQDSFFEVGGDSARLAALHGALQGLTNRDLSLAELFDHPTVAAMAALVAGRASGPDPTSRAPVRMIENDAIAIVGLSCRMPGATDAEAFWRALVAGERAIEATAEASADPDWVGVRATLPGATRFDADYFGYSPAEAIWIDPQQRILLECAVEALEDAGCDPAQFAGAIGVFAGCGVNLSRMSALLAQQTLPRSAESWLALLGADKDYLALRLAYKLDLKGPAVTVQSACSTALTAVHQAILSLRAGDCDLALAGGVSIADDGAARGYRFVAGDVMSGKGLIRPFDAEADGTVFGDGAGLVALKRLADAQRDRDSIRAVIRGSAINNDGGGKMGFTAPSARGQAEVIRKALDVAGVDAESIGYVETHGTGTLLGDPIEVSALGQALGAANGSERVLGALKANVGHLNAAAGVAGLIKATLAVERGLIPPHPTFERPNPLIDLSTGGFVVNTQPVAWPSTAVPRRAGVSAFGFGGTNAHVVVEQPPATATAPASPRDQHVLVLSARSPEALDAMSTRLADYLGANPDLDIADVAATLLSGRTRHPHVRAVVCQDVNEAVLGLQQRDRLHVFEGRRPSRAEPPICLLFPGQGSQRAGMGRDLYAREPVFRETIDTCAAILAETLPDDLRALLFADDAGAEDVLASTAIAQPALFAFEYALARLWMDRGLRPDAMLGHSLGEFVAACLAEVFSLEDALRTVALRGRLMQAQPPGAMAAIGSSSEALASRLPETLALAAVNGPRQCVVSGPEDALARLVRDLRSESVPTAYLRTSHAFHSPMMRAARDPFVDHLGALALRAPSTPFISNLTGDWITDEQATDPRYWGEHILGCVRFGEGLERLDRDLPGAVLLEVGTGQTLQTLARARPAGKEGAVVASLPSGKTPGGETRELACASAKLLLAGVEQDLERLYPEGRRRVRLPTYPFESKELAAPDIGPLGVGPARVTAVQQTGWMRHPLSGARARATPRKVAIHGVEGPLRAALIQAFAAVGSEVRLLAASEPLGTDAPLQAAEDLVLLVGPKAPCSEMTIRRLSAAQRGDARLIVVSIGGHDVIGGEAVDPEVAWCHVLARASTIDRSSLRFRGYDFAAEDVETGSGALARSVAEDDWSDVSSDLVAFRRGVRWVHRADIPVPLDVDAAPRATRWLVVGDRAAPASRIVVQALSGPGRQTAWLAPSSASSDGTWSLIDLARRPGELGASVETDDKLALDEAMARIRSELGSIEGVLQILPDFEGRETEAPDAPKAPGLNLAAALQTSLAGAPPDVHVLFSTNPEQGHYEAMATSAQMAGAVITFAWDIADAGGPAPSLLPALIASGAANLRIRRAGKSRSPPQKQRETPAHRSLPSPYVAPVSPTEIAVAEIIAQTLNVDRVGLEDDFFQLGGHSLLGMQVATWVRERLGVSLQLRALFDDPTVRGIAAQIASTEWEEIEI